MSWQLYFQRAFSLIEFQDFIPATMKTAVFGMIIGTIASYLGFTTTQGTEGVGRASTRAVVISSILIIMANVVLVRLIFFLYPAQRMTIACCTSRTGSETVGAAAQPAIQLEHVSSRSTAARCWTMCRSTCRRAPRSVSLGGAEPARA